MHGAVAELCVSWQARHSRESCRISVSRDNYRGNVTSGSDLMKPTKPSLYSVYNLYLSSENVRVIEYDVW